MRIATAPRKKTEFKNAGMDWLTQVPAHWQTPPLYARFRVELGKMLDAKRITGEHLLPYVRNVDVQWDHVNVNDLREMDITPDEYPRYTLKSGDLLVCEGGEVGRTAIWRGELPICAFQKAIHRLRPLSGRDLPRFLYYVMRAAASTGVFIAHGNPNTIAHLTAEKLRVYRFAFPPLDEQRAIAAFLHRETARIDTLIEKKQRQIELLHEKRTALISHAVTKGLDPDAPMKDSGIEWLGEVPKHWHTCPLMFLTPPFRQIMYGIVLPGPHKEGGIPIVKAGNVAPGKLRRELLKCTTPEIERKFARARLQAGDLVFAIRGSIGAAEMVPDDVAGANITQDVARVAPRAGVNPGWLLYALQAGPIQAQAAAGILGATVKGLNIRDLKRLRLAVPPLAEQTRIADHLNNATGRIHHLTAKVQESIDRLREYRAALISAAVTGKIDIRWEVAG